VRGQEARDAKRATGNAQEARSAERATGNAKTPTQNQLGDAPILTDNRKQMKQVARLLDNIFNGESEALPLKNGFILMVFPFSEHGGRCNYISNAQRDDVVVMLKEQLARFEGQPEQVGRA